MPRKKDKGQKRPTQDDSLKKLTKAIPTIRKAIKLSDEDKRYIEEANKVESNSRNPNLNLFLSNS